MAGAEQWLFRPEPSWPLWRFLWEPVALAHEPSGDSAGEPETVREEKLTDEIAVVLASAAGGWIEMDRAAQETRLHLPEPLTPEALVHPYLTSTAAISAHWLGRTPFHAGAFAVDGRVWGVLGNREMGKSSLLMGLHVAGVPVVSDDLVVVEKGRVYAGPRCLDLRESAAERFGAGRALGRIGRRDRWRVDLPPVAKELPLAGWVLLGWSEEAAVECLGAAGRLAALARNRAVVAPGTTPHELLDAAALPVLHFSRPKDWSQLTRGLDQLADACVAYDRSAS